MLAGDTPLSGVQRQMEMAQQGAWTTWNGGLWLGTPGTSLFPNLTTVLLRVVPVA